MSWSMEHPDSEATEDAARSVADFVVQQTSTVANGVRLLRLTPLDGSDVRPWTPGSHIDVVLPSGEQRQYSLCGDPADRGGYTIGVLRANDGRGGSLEVHGLEAATAVVGVRGPRNAFDLVEADSYEFIAAGIGITPIRPMVRALVAAGRTQWTLHYGGRARAAMAFLDEFLKLGVDRVQISVREEGSRIDVATVVAACPPGTAVYACGPTGLLEEVALACEARRGELDLHVERFGAAPATPINGGTFAVELRRTGVTVEVPPDRSILDVVLDVVPDAPYGCMEGYCGGCELRVLEGTPEHHDDFLTEQEQKENATMMICVGRAVSSRLVLDL